MKKLKIELDIDKIKKCEEFFKTTVSSELWVIMLHHAVNKLYKDGLNPQTQRRCFNLCNKLEECKESVIELEDAQFELIAEAFEKAKFPSLFGDTLEQIYEAIDDTKLKEKEKKENEKSDPKK